MGDDPQQQQQAPSSIPVQPPVTSEINLDNVVINHNVPLKTRDDQHSWCLQVLDTCLGDRRLRDLLISLRKLGCMIELDKFLHCEPCTSPATAFFDKERGVIVCENNAYKRPLAEQQTMETIVHEFIHVYDNCRAHVDYNNCSHIACTEIRAANLSGECNWVRELPRGTITRFRGHKRECVKRRAGMSVESYPMCKGKSKQIMSDIWDICYYDFKPWSTIP